MGLSTVVLGLNPDAVQIYTNMPRDPRRAAGIDCSREGLSGAKLMFFFFFTAYFRKNVFFEVKKKEKRPGNSPQPFFFFSIFFATMSKSS